jgi:mono/diheme cytochrome c family protein
LFASRYYLTLFTAALLGAACSDSDADSNNNVADTAISGDSAVPEELGAVDAPASPVGPWNTGIPIPHIEQDKGDSQAGYHALLHKGYVSCGIPYELFKMVDPSLIGPIKDVEKLSDRDGENANVPYSWTIHTAESGVQLASQNCLTCHAGRFNGELILGLGNADADFTWDQSTAATGITIPEGVLPESWVAEIQKFVDRISVLGPQTVMKTVGTNPAEMVAVTLAAHRNQQTLEWSQEALVEIPNFVVPSDPPPWWWMKKKNAMFYTGMGRGQHRRIMMTASSLCTDSVEEAQEIDSYFDDISAYIYSLEAPQYPFEVDSVLAEQGKELFAKSCSGCHGTYGEDESYPNLLIPLDTIGTDPTVAMGGTSVEYGKHLVEWYNGSFYGEIAWLDIFEGYVAPPLDGIWATGPFLHNGSVPTIELVLNSKARPTYWKRENFDSTHFDQNALGWPHEVLDYGQADASSGERRFIYDTTLEAHHNTGHNFGDHLSDEQRRAVIEYLKTL